MRARIARRMLIVSSGALALLLMWPSNAHAVIAGPCTAEINGVNLTQLNPTKKSDAVVLEKDATVSYSGESLVPPNNLKIDLEFLGMIRWTVTNKRLNGRDQDWSSTAQVSKYARFGVGLYRVYGRAIGPRPCVGSALIRVKGNPLATAGGIAGAASSGLGVVGLGVGTARAGRVRRLPFMGGMLWLVAIVAPVIGSPAAAGAAAPGRIRNRPVLSVSGIVGGLLLGFGIAVLLQQYSIIYPTKNLSIAMLAGGVVAGVILPSLARMGAVGKANAQRAQAVDTAWEAPPPVEEPQWQAEPVQGQTWGDEAPASHEPPPPPEEPAPPPPWQG